MNKKFKTKINLIFFLLFSDCNSAGSLNSTPQHQPIPNITTIVKPNSTTTQQKMSGSKLYIGNLGPDVSQELIMRELSREKQIEVSNIVLNKRGFAFVDLQDNVALDKAIEKLSGMKINGKEISVEHSGKK